MRIRKSVKPLAGPQLPLNSTDGKNPFEIWTDYFSKRRPKPLAVSKTILELHKARKHDHVIAVIEAALIHGQGQPWMYDVLVGSMKVVKRPQSEINRVLASRIDISGTDVPSMMYTAAHFVRYGGYKLALRLYRQASRLNPTRPEPYILGLKLARQQKDYDAIRWAAAGILTTAWTRNHAFLHKAADAAAVNAYQELVKAGRLDEAKQMKQAIAEAHQRDLVLKLTWSGNGDLDLYIDEPSGSICSANNPQTIGGGVLVHDGYGPRQENSYEEYVCANGMPGKYRVRIRHVYGDIVGKRATLKVVRGLGTKYQSVRTFTVQLSQQDKVVRLSLPKGRRKKAAIIPDRKQSLFSPRRGRPTLLRRFGRLTPAGRAAGRAFAQSRRITSGGNVGYRSVVSLISEGVSMSAMAVVSGDRRYVRITTSPQFRTITDVFTFSFINSGGNPTGNPGLRGGN